MHLIHTILPNTKKFSIQNSHPLTLLNSHNIHKKKNTSKLTTQTNANDPTLGINQFNECSLWCSIVLEISTFFIIFFSLIIILVVRKSRKLFKSFSFLWLFFCWVYCLCEPFFFCWGNKGVFSSLLQTTLPPPLRWIFNKLKIVLSGWSWGEIVWIFLEAFDGFEWKACS